MFCAHCPLNTEKTLIPSSLFPSLRYIIHIHGILLGFVFSRQSCPDPLRLSSHKRCSSPTTIFVTLHWTQTIIFGCPLMWGASTPALPHQGWVMQDVINALTQREEITGKTYDHLNWGETTKYLGAECYLSQIFQKTLELGDVLKDSNSTLMSPREKLKIFVLIL